MKRDSRPLVFVYLGGKVKRLSSKNGENAKNLPAIGFPWRCIHHGATVMIQYEHMTVNTDDKGNRGRLGCSYCGYFLADTANGSIARELACPRPDTESGTA
jgi:hypothetical protein